MQTCSIDFFSFYLFVVYTENFPQETVMHLKIQKENKQQNENPFFPFSCMPERHRYSNIIYLQFFVPSTQKHKDKKGLESIRS